MIHALDPWAQGGSPLLLTPSFGEVLEDEGQTMGIAAKKHPLMAVLLQTP